MKTIDKIKKYFAETRILRRGLNLQEQFEAINKGNERFLKKAIKHQKFDDEAVIKLFLFSNLAYHYYEKYNCSNVVKMAILQSSSDNDYGIPYTIIMEFNFRSSDVSIASSRLLCLQVLFTEDDKVISFFQKTPELNKFKRRVDEINSINAYDEAIEASGERVTLGLAMGGDFGCTSLYTPINMEWVEDKVAEYIPSEETQKKIVAINNEVLTETMQKELTEFEAWWVKAFGYERKFLMV